MKTEYYRQYLDMMNQWLILYQEGKGIDKYLLSKSYKSVAIYGMAIYGRNIVRDLQKSEVNIAYGIDQRKMKPYKSVEILQPIGKLPEVDVIINTVIHEHDSIKNNISKLTAVPVISLEDIIFESY